ncbi:gpi mannosyltransferase 3 [Anaeramoeba ignava]|uniref:Mannosyltransferase n=1 Tax=Anaeramoeba ignava TaxID=1746090 RepID=A0A9Q0LM84_ANAIG|nr:gpi mannosyltransferase 3 [Anaeramoeba ignava]
MQSSIMLFFCPDEYWQSLEVAHNIVFKYGYLTWEWKEKLRGFLHPLIFAVLYKILQIFQLDKNWILILSPRILQAAFASLCDLFVWKISIDWFNKSVAKFSLLLNLISWLAFYLSTRTLANSLETTLIIVALYYYQKPKISQQNFGIFLFSIGFIVRPTSATIFIFLIFHMIFSRIKTWRKRIEFVALRLFPISFSVFIVSVLLDSFLFGSFTIVQINFLKFNFLEDRGSFYGTHEWFWFLSFATPLILTSLLPFFIHGVFVEMRKNTPNKVLLPFWIILFDIAFYSISSHKEFRFIYPIHPLMVIYSASSLSRIISSFSSSFSDDPKTEKEVDFVSPKKEEKTQTKPRKTRSKFWGNLILSVLIITQLGQGVYLGYVHQKGRIDVFSFIQKETESFEQKNQEISVLFLTPCHSTPFYSHIHKNISMDFLDCSPSSEPNYVDEADRFFANPLDFLHKRFLSDPQNVHLPSHLILFDSILPKIESFLKENSYQECARFFNSHFPVDRELQKYLLVFCSTS